MGGSTTANIKLKTSYSQLLEEQLDTHFKDLEVRCFNGARGGWSTNHTLVRIATEIVFLEPDIITVMHTANDMHELMFPGVQEEYFVRNAKYFFPRYFPFLQRASELKSDLLTKVLYNPLLNQHSVLNQVFYRLSVYLESPERNQVALPEGLIERGMEEFRRNLISMVGLATSVNAQLVLISQPHRFERGIYYSGFETIGYSINYPSMERAQEIHSRYTQVLRDVAAQHENCVYVPMAERFETELLPSYLRDIMHYTVAGLEEFADLAFDDLVRQVERRQLLVRVSDKEVTD